MEVPGLEANLRHSRFFLPLPPSISTMSTNDSPLPPPTEFMTLVMGRIGVESSRGRDFLLFAGSSLVSGFLSRAQLTSLSSARNLKNAAVSATVPKEALTLKDFKRGMATARRQAEQDRQTPLYFMRAFKRNHPHIAVAASVTLVVSGIAISASSLFAFLLKAIGFGSAGPLAKSIAVFVQSKVYGGATGGVFSVFQSLGATVAAPSTTSALAGALATAAGSIGLKTQGLLKAVSEKLVSSDGVNNSASHTGVAHTLSRMGLAVPSLNGYARRWFWGARPSPLPDKRHH